MLLKYKYDSDISLTEIGDVTVDSKNCCVDFKPLDNSVKSIRLNGVTTQTIDEIIKNLYEIGRADVSDFGNCEMFNSNDDDEETEERGDI